MKMRTISEAYAEIKSCDPDTGMTLSGLRRLVSTGKIPSIRIGRRILIDYGNLHEHLSNPTIENVSDNTYGQIRKIAK